MSAQLITGGRVATPDGVLDPGWLLVENGLISALGGGEAPKRPDALVTDASGNWVVPGFVDIHCHGGGGAAFSNTDPAHVRRVVDAHTAHGTTTMLASLVTRPVSELVEQVAALADLVQEDLIA